MFAVNLALRVCRYQLTFQFEMRSSFMLKLKPCVQSLPAAHVRRVLVFGAFVLACLCAAQAGFAQTIDTGTVRGHVADQNGAAVVGANVSATNDVTGFKREARTDEGGNYTLAGLPLTGKYHITVTQSGFAPRELDVELRAGVAATVDVTLTPAD